MNLSRATSITHEHLLAIINTECDRFQGEPIRILDAGCGDGELIAYLQENLPLLKPTKKFEIYGYDVCDSGVQCGCFFANTLNFLNSKFNGIKWSERLNLISEVESLPYQDGFFHIIISNQVLEHVNNHDLFFSQIKRTLCSEGFSVHLFPLKHYIYEGHLHLPFVHRILNYDILFSYIRWLSRFGFGKFQKHKKDMKVNINTYTERHADYMIHFTNYVSYKEVLLLGKKHHLRSSFKYTNEFYIRKIRSVLRLRPKYSYKRNRSAIVGMLSVLFLKNIFQALLYFWKIRRCIRKNYEDSVIISLRSPRCQQPLSLLSIFTVFAAARV